MKKKKIPKKFNSKIAIVFGVIILGLSWLYRLPQISTNQQNFPVIEYNDAQNLIAELKQKDSSEINSDCYSQIFDHGERTEKVIVMIHGFTNCPKQFVSLGRQFFDLGYNVVIIRQPYHGNSDRLSPEISKLTKEELISYTTDSVTIASGLGQEITVMGLSSGGVMAAWAAQRDPRVNQAVVVAPLFGLGYFDILTTPIAKTVSVLPNQFRWWDDETKDKAVGPLHAYPWYSTHALAEIMLLGQIVRQSATDQPPMAQRIVVITNASDKAVNQRAVNSLIHDWESYGGNVIHHHFPQDLGLLHDLIDEDQIGAKTDIVYPKIIELVENK